MSIVSKLAAVSAQVGAVGKTGRNDKQGYNFRGIDAVVNAVGPAFRDAGIIVLPEVLSVDYEAVEVGNNRTPMGHVRVVVRYRFTDGAEHLDATVAGEAMDSGDKATAKAMSVAFRTCLLQTLCLPTDEKDPDADSYERTSTERRAPAPRQATSNPAPAVTIKNQGDPASDKQLGAIRALSKQLGKLPPANLAELTKQQASDLIGQLDAEKANAQADISEPF